MIKELMLEQVSGEQKKSPSHTEERRKEIIEGSKKRTLTEKMSLKPEEDFPFHTQEGTKLAVETSEDGKEIEVLVKDIENIKECLEQPKVREIKELKSDGDELYKEKLEELEEKDPISAAYYFKSEEMSEDAERCFGKAQEKIMDIPE